MDFSKRLSRVAAIATWGGIALALIGAVVLRQHHDAAFTLHFYAFLGWQALAIVNALAAVGAADAARHERARAQADHDLPRAAAAQHHGHGDRCGCGQRRHPWPVLDPLPAQRALRRHDDAAVAVGAARRPRRPRRRGVLRDRAHPRREYGGLVRPRRARLPRHRVVQRHSRLLGVGHALTRQAGARRAAAPGRGAVPSRSPRRPRATSPSTWAARRSRTRRSRSSPTRSATP